MAIKRYAGDRFVGLSTDVKPLNVPDGATYDVTDTLASYIKVNGSWQIMSGGASPTGTSGYSGYSGYSGSIGNSGISGYSGYSGSGVSGRSGYSGYSGWSGRSGYSGYSGTSGSGISGYSGISGFSGISGWSGRSGYSGFSGISGYSGYSGSGVSGYSGYSGRSGSGISGYSGYSGLGLSGYSGFSGASTSGYSGFSGLSGRSGYSGFSGITWWDIDTEGDLIPGGDGGGSGYSGYSGISGYSGYSGRSGYSGSGVSGYSGYSGSGVSGYSGTSGYSGYSGTGVSGYSGYSGVSGYSGTISKYIEIKPSDVAFDSTDIGVDFSSAFTVSDCIDFSASVKGSIWFNFEMRLFDIAKDIKMEFVYNINANDSNKNINLEATYWCSKDGELPNVASPSQALASSNLSSGVTYDVLKKTNLTSLDLLSATLEATDTIFVKLSRDASDAVNDTYSGVFQLLKIVIYQV